MHAHKEDAVITLFHDEVLFEHLLVLFILGPIDEVGERHCDLLC